MVKALAWLRAHSGKPNVLLGVDEWLKIPKPSRETLWSRIAFSLDSDPQFVCLISVLNVFPLQQDLTPSSARPIHYVPLPLLAVAK